MLFTSDEEIGSPSTRDVIEAEAARHATVLVPEPGGPGHEVTTGRYAIARFAIETTGRPSHAGARLAEGRSAIHAMASRIAEIEDMTTDDCTFSVGVIRGGEWVNCVATTCTAQVLSMAKRQADLDRGVERMLALAGQANDVRFDVSRTVTRPVWEPDMHAPSRSTPKPKRWRSRSASPCPTAAPAAAPTATSPAPPASRRSTASACSAPAATRSRNISSSTAWSRAAACWPA